MKRTVSRNKCIEALVENTRFVRNGALESGSGRTFFDDNQRIISEYRESFNRGKDD